ncbi:MAG TPA: hypothetical protein ACHBX0_00870 [Arsenophonus sp.]
MSLLRRNSRFSRSNSFILLTDYLVSKISGVVPGATGKHVLNGKFCPLADGVAVFFQEMITAIIMLKE